MRVFLWLGVTRQHQPGTIHHGNPDLDHLDRRQFFEHRGRRQSRRVQHQAVLQGDLQTVSQERNQRVRWLTSRQRGASFRWLGLCDRKPSAATSWPCGPPSARESCPKKWTFQAEGTRPSLPSAGRGAKNGRISSCSPAATRRTFSRGVEPPLFPCPKKFTFWDTTLLPRGTFWVRVRAGPLADAPRPFSSCSPAAPRKEYQVRVKQPLDQGEADRYGFKPQRDWRTGCLLLRVTPAGSGGHGSIQFLLLQRPTASLRAGQCHVG